MAENENLRLKKLTRWLIGQGIVQNQEELAHKMGYAKSSFSQIVNEKVKLTGKFVNRITALDPRINRHWVTSGEGEMILVDKNPKVEASLFDQRNDEDVEKENEKNLRLLVNTLEEKQKELDGQKILVAILTDRIQEMNKRILQQEEVIREITKGGDKSESVPGAARIA